VALIDPVWVGHHPMYFSQFIASFLRVGARVIALCPQPDAARDDLARSADGEFLSQPEHAVHFAKLPTGGRSFFNGKFEGDPARTFTRWRRAADAVATAAAQTGWTVDLVYFPYLDSYLRFLPFPMVPDAVLNKPWSGLYLRNHHHGENPSLFKFLRLLAKGDALVRSQLCRGIGVLDERFIPAMERLTRKAVTAYPDVTQGGLPDQPFPLAMEIRRKAAGRVIVGMIGLERRKGFLTFMRTAALARERNLPIYFAATGTIYPSEYSPAERSEIDDTCRRIGSGEIDNLHFDPAAGRISSEADFNFLFSSFHIAWAAYEGFQGSSGTLSKAALFELPCLATEGECVGLRVESYRLGLTIPEAAPDQALAAISRLAEGTDHRGEPLSPRFADYRNDHSLARLDRILASLLDRV
jgi:hypothetical protein